MTSIALDSSVFLAQAFTEERTAQALVLFEEIERQEIAIHAPTLLYYELASVIRKAVYSGRVTPAEGLVIRNELLAGRIELHFERALIERAYELAQKLNQPRAYDTQYLALVEHLGCEFWTNDERLYNAARNAFPLVRWLGNIEV